MPSLALSLSLTISNSTFFKGKEWQQQNKIVKKNESEMCVWVCAGMYKWKLYYHCNDDNYKKAYLDSKHYVVVSFSFAVYKRALYSVLYVFFGDWSSFPSPNNGRTGFYFTCKYLVNSHFLFNPPPSLCQSLSLANWVAYKFKLILWNKDVLMR